MSEPLSMIAEATQGILPPRTRVQRAIRLLLSTGKYRQGESFPSERTLADDLRVGRGVVRGVLAELRREGLLESGKGRSLTVSQGRSSQGLLNQTIVVLTPTVKVQPDHQGQGWAEYIAQGAVNALRTDGRPTMIIDPSHLQGERLQTLLRDPPLGVVFPEIPDDPRLPLEQLDELRRAGVPLVVYGGAPELQRFDRVRSDHDEGCYQLTRCLISRGCRHIRCLFTCTWRDMYWAADRYRGYTRAMREAGLQVWPVSELPEVQLRTGQGDVPAVRDPMYFEARVRLMAGYLLPLMTHREHPEALLVMTDGVVTEASSALRLFGKQPNREVLIGGYDNYWAEDPCNQLETAPPAASVDKRNYEMGAEMVRLLLSRVGGHLPEEPQERVVPPRLIEDPTSVRKQ